MQQSAPKKHVVIVGAGALGSHVVLLARNWDARITIIDHDRVEQKNVQSQFHTKMALRKNKAQALGQAMQGMFGKKLRVVPHKLTTDNVVQLLNTPEGAHEPEDHLVIDCTDNIEARLLIQKHCDFWGIPCLHGCLAATGDFVRIIWSEHFKPDPEGFEGEATCEGGEQLPFYAVAGGLITMVAQQFLDEGKRVNLQATPFGVIRL